MDHYGPQSPWKDKAVRIPDIEWMKDQEFVFTNKNYFDEIIQGKVPLAGRLESELQIVLDNYGKSDRVNHRLRCQ